MTTARREILPAPRATGRVAPSPDDLRAPAPGHAGCYWDCLLAAWVPYPAVPLPRPAQD